MKGAKVFDLVYEETYSGKFMLLFSINTLVFSTSL